MAQYARGFTGNIRIRGVGVPVQWDEQRLAEFTRCAEDPLYFFRNYVYIKDVDKENLVLFKPRSYQEEMLDKMLHNRNVIVKLPRQCGKTTLSAAVLLWHLIFHHNFSILVAAHKGDKARDVLNNVKEMYEALPDFLQHGVESWNKGSIKLETGSRIRSSATSASAARGDVYNMVYLDEFAFVAKHLADEFVKSVIPTVSSGKTTKIFITSTPKGLNLFYDMWEAAINPDPEKWSGYAHVEIKWNDVPGRDEEFRRNVIAQFGEDYFDQEYGAEFLGSSRTLISGSKLLSLTKRITRPLDATATTRKYLLPERGRKYAVTVDVSEGLGADYHAVVAFDITQLPYKVAAVFKSNQLDPLALPGVVHEFAVNYNNALVLVEANFGQQVGEVLYNEYEYENMVMTSKGKTGPHAKQERISAGYGTKVRVGLAQNANSKRIGCSNLKTLIEGDHLEVPDAWVVEELKRFAVNKKSYAAEDGHDDLVMCLVLFAWMVDQGYVREETDVAARDRIREMNLQAIENDMMPTGWTVRGDEPEDEMIYLAPKPNHTDIPNYETGEANAFQDLFDRKVGRKGMTESQLHDLFIRDMFERASNRR